MLVVGDGHEAFYTKVSPELAQHLQRTSKALKDVIEKYIKHFRGEGFDRLEKQLAESRQNPEQSLTCNELNNFQDALHVSNELTNIIAPMEGHLTLPSALMLGNSIMEILEMHKTSREASHIGGPMDCAYHLVEQHGPELLQLAKDAQKSLGWANGNTLADRLTAFSGGRSK